MPDTLTPETRIRCGDIVRHRPTGETWVVAYADYERDELAWQGWPDGFARLHDCELVEPCSDEEHARNVRMCIEANLGNRTSAVRRLYVEASHEHPDPETLRALVEDDLRHEAQEAQ